MLQSIVNARKHARIAQERLYEYTCDVVERVKAKRPNGSTYFTEETVLENQPCRISFTTTNVNNTTDTTSNAVQKVTLHISPDAIIKTGSKIIVDINGSKTEYKHSGYTAMYATHQEIDLELFKEWS